MTRQEEGWGSNLAHAPSRGCTAHGARRCGGPAALGPERIDLRLERQQLLCHRGEIGDAAEPNRTQRSGAGPMSGRGVGNRKMGLR